MGVSHGEPCVTLGAAAQAVGRSVRVTGRLASFNPQEARALIKHRGEELWIDTSFLTGSRLQEAELLQFIGEAFAGGAGGPPGEPDTYVRARVVRNVENLDLEMYERAVLATRQFLVDGTSSSALAIPARQRPTAEHWGCDPVWKSSAKLLAAQLAALPWAAETAGSRDLVCWLGSHPVRHVDVMGVVVSLDPRAPREADERVSLTLDDGGGLVECVWWATGAAAAHRAQLLGALRLGALLHVLGRLGQFREQMQLTIDHAWLEVDPMAERARSARARARAPSAPRRRRCSAQSTSSCSRARSTS